MQAKNDDDVVMTFMEVKGQGIMVKYDPSSMAIKLGQKNHWCKFKVLMTFMKVKGQQSNIVTLLHGYPT